MKAKSRKFPHLPNDVLHAEILNLKSKQEEIRSQQVTFKQGWDRSILGHGLFRGRIKILPLSQQLRRWCKQNLWKNTPYRQENWISRWEVTPYLTPLQIILWKWGLKEAKFLWDTLSLPYMALDRAWLGYNSTLFLRFRIGSDWLCILVAKRKLFLFPTGFSWTRPHPSTGYGT